MIYKYYENNIFSNNIYYLRYRFISISECCNRHTRRYLRMFTSKVHRIWRAIQIYNCVRIHDPSERIRGPSRLRLFYRTIHPINLVNANRPRVPFHNLARNRVYLLYLHMPRSQCTNVRVKVMDST